MNQQQPIYGVNLGGWLVLEKWMTPQLFDGTQAADEYTLCQVQGAGMARRLKEHRETFVTKKDFVWLRDNGVQAVRLPVGYGAFGNEPPYTRTIEYVDRAFKWAEETGLVILLDLHTAPGSQNGLDHSGRRGEFLWHKNEANIIKTLEILTKLAKRYAGHTSLLGIELLNEPEAKIPRKKIMKYYEAAYRMIRTECGLDTWVVFSDSFKPKLWKRKFQRSDYINMFIDTHHYQTFSKKDKKRNVFEHIERALKELPGQLAKMGKAHPVIVGEWSLALDTASLEGLDEVGREAAIRAFAAAQLLAFQNTRAWFFWSYKTQDGGMWSYRDAVTTGRLPVLPKK